MTKKGSVPAIPYRCHAQVGQGQAHDIAVEMGTHGGYDCGYAPIPCGNLNC
jgi:hypothetical protein